MMSRFRDDSQRPNKTKEEVFQLSSVEFVWLLAETFDNCLVQSLAETDRRVSDQWGKLDDMLNRGSVPANLTDADWIVWLLTIVRFFYVWTSLQDTV